MNTKEKYNELIIFIEEEVTAKYPRRLKEIVEGIQRDYFFSPREMNAIFRFLMNSTLPEYIRERKMMAAYSNLINATDWKEGVEKAMIYSDSSDQSNLNSKFRDRFNLTPKEAFEQKDQDRIVPIQTWEYISSENFDAIEAKDNSVIPSKIFGIDQKQFELAQEASDYQSLYSMSQEKSEVAFHIAQVLGVPMKDAFDFVDETGAVGITTRDTKEEILSDKLTYCYFELFKGYVSLNLIYIFLNEVRIKNIDFTKFVLGEYECEILEEVYYCKDYDTFTILELVYLADRFNYMGSEVDFFDFLTHLNLGYSLEDAVKEDDYHDMDRDVWEEEIEYSMNKLEADLSFERWATEQMDYEDYSGVHDYDNYDVDNPYYCNADVRTEEDEFEELGISYEDN